MRIIIVILTLVLGAMMGSFAACQAWRLRYRQTGKKPLGRWSVCLSCHHKLAWYENIPIVSWLALRGKCKHCGKKIGSMEILSEVGLMVVFGALLWFFHAGVFAGDAPAILQLALLMVEATAMWVLLLYDARWGELPTHLLIFCIIIAAVFHLVAGIADVVSLIGAIVILPGVYLLLYVASRERLVGAGDWLLCLAIAIILGNWWLALITLFAANFLGSLIMLPVSLKTKNHTIHFAPFLISAFLIVFLLQDFLKSILIAS